VPAERVIQFLQKVRNAYPDAKIVVVLDNARYNYAKDTRAFAEENNILLLFLPPYAPNLNLIERLWKFAKKHLVRYFLQQFRRLLSGIEESIDTKVPNYTCAAV
jgi:transposase